MKGSMVKKTIIEVLHTLKHAGKIWSYAAKMNIMFKSFSVCKILFKREQWDGLGMVHSRVALESTCTYAPIVFNSKGIRCYGDKMEKNFLWDT